MVSGIDPVLRVIFVYRDNLKLGPSLPLGGCYGDIEGYSPFDQSLYNCTVEFLDE